MDKCSVNSYVVSEVKSEILNRFKHGHNYDPYDLKLITENDWLISRIITVCGNLEPDQLIKTTITKVDTHLKIRLQYSMSSMISTQIPRQFYELELFKVGHDDRGQMVLVVNLRNFFIMPGFSEPFIECCVLWIEMLLRSLRPFEQAIAFADISQLSLKECDLRMALKVNN